MNDLRATVYETCFKGLDQCGRRESRITTQRYARTLLLKALGVKAHIGASQILSEGIVVVDADYAADIILTKNHRLHHWALPRYAIGSHNLSLSLNP